MLDYSRTRFLIVDDFSDFRTSLKSMLRDLGAKDVDTADRGEDTLVMCRHKRYDIILHDYNLGAGKNGQQVLEELIAGKNSFDRGKVHPWNRDMSHKAKNGENGEGNKKSAA